MNEPLPPAARLLQITGQVQLARALALTVELGIADRIEAQAQTAPQLAESLNCFTVGKPIDLASVK